MIKLEKMSVKFPELDLIAEWRNQSMISLRSSDLTAKGESQRKWVESFGPSEKYYFIYLPAMPSHNAQGYTETKLLGYCGLDKIDPVNRSAELSLLISPEHQDKGHGKEVVKKLLDMAFTKFNLNLVFIEYYLTGLKTEFFWNSNFGFEHEGRLRDRKFYRDVYYDSCTASITKEEYEKQLLSEVP